MENEIISEGICIYCGEMFSQKEIIRHLGKHLSLIEKENPSAMESAYHLNISDGDYFLQVLVKGSASFKTLDTFLRKIWLECCGHLSEFKHKDFRIGMSRKFDDVLSPNLKFMHDYDFGSTTRLALQVKGKYNFCPDENVKLLSRNEPLKIMCSYCKFSLRPLFAQSICLKKMKEDIVMIV